jgi:hypothetical protein
MNVCLLDLLAYVLLHPHHSHTLLPCSQVLVDAAAYAPTQPLNLSNLDADFVDIAFYKLFGNIPQLLSLLRCFFGAGVHVLCCSQQGPAVYIQLSSLCHSAE